MNGLSQVSARQPRSDTVFSSSSHAMTWLLLKTLSAYTCDVLESRVRNTRPIVPSPSPLRMCSGVGVL